MSAIGDVKNTLFSYQGISNYLENKSLDEKLLQLAEMTAKILSADNCSIMLFGNTESKNSHMRVCASYVDRSGRPKAICTDGSIHSSRECLNIARATLSRTTGSSATTGSRGSPPTDSVSIGTRPTQPGSTRWLSQNRGQSMMNRPVRSERRESETSSRRRTCCWRQPSTTRRHD